jgi:hypothetical protein
LHVVMRSAGNFLLTNHSLPGSVQR